MPRNILLCIQNNQYKCWALNTRTNTTCLCWTAVPGTNNNIYKNLSIIRFPSHKASSAILWPQIKVRAVNWRPGSMQCGVNMVNISKVFFSYKRKLYENLHLFVAKVWFDVNFVYTELGRSGSTVYALKLHRCIDILIWI